MFDSVSPRSPAPSLSLALRRAPATFAFLGACAVVFALAEAEGSTHDAWTLVRFGATERGRVWDGEVWRLVTAAFLHIGILHLLWNVVTMLFWCAPVERALGTARFAVLYLGSAVAASATSLASYDVVGAGASGAGFGVIGATLAMERRRLGSWRAFAADGRVRLVAAIAVLWPVALLRMNVDHAAHLGGLAGGAVLTWALTVPAAAARAARRRAIALAAAVVGLPVALAVVPRPGLTRHAERTLVRDLGAAIDRGDLDHAERILERAASARHAAGLVGYGRGIVLERRGDLDGAARAYEGLARAEDPQARRLGARASKVLLARRLANGLGIAADPERAIALLAEVCAEDAAAVAAGEERERAPFCDWVEARPPLPATTPARGP
jgi:membrane associated rhomboid family serine protease